MSAGKGDKPRPFSVTRKEYDVKHDNINFSKHSSKDGFVKNRHKITKTYK